MGFKITGTGSCVPEFAVSNDMLGEFLDTNDEWISSRTGIKSRNILKDGESLLSLAVEAARRAIENASTDASEIDMVIVSTLQGEFISPAMSCLVAKEIGSPADKAFDINMGCCGFVFALDMAETYLSAGKAENVLIVCAEQLSKFVDWNDRSTCVLFGDGAGAVVVKRSDEDNSFITKIDGSYENLNIAPTIGNCPFRENAAENKFLSMNGREIFKFAVSSIVEDIGYILDKNSLTADDIAYFVLHQANFRILNFAKQKLEQPDEKFPYNVDTRGNTSSASIPVLLDEMNRAGKLKKGDKLVLSAFGAGLSRGACLVNWCI